MFSYDFAESGILSSIKLAVTAGAALAVHFMARTFSARVIANRIAKFDVVERNLSGKDSDGNTLAGNIKQAFLKNTQPLRSIFRPMPVGWSMRTRRILAEVRADASEFIQSMNDRYTRPSGESAVIQAAEDPRIDAGARDDAASNVETLKTVNASADKE